MSDETIETITGFTPQEIEQGVKGLGDTLRETIKDHIPVLFEFGVRCLVAFIIFIIGRLMIRWIRGRVRRSFEKRDADVGAMKFTDSLVKAVLYLILLLLVAANLGVELSSVTVLFASAGVGITLALQESLSNLAGGIMILLLKPFKVGDYIIESTNKMEGTVQEIRLFHTMLWTLDSRLVVIPNGQLMNNSLTNITANEERQLDLKIQISYSSDLRKAKEVIEGILRRDPRILEDRDVYVFVDSLGEHAVVLGARAWAKKADYFRVRWDVQEAVKLTFDEVGIVIPFNQVTVHMADD